MPLPATWERPFLSPKYDITQHPRYKYLSDYDKKNTFDVEKHLARLRKPRPPVATDVPFHFFDLDDTDHG
jgi:type IV secretion system protein VirD4